MKHFSSKQILFFSKHHFYDSDMSRNVPFSAALAFFSLSCAALIPFPPSRTSESSYSSVASAERHPYRCIYLPVHRLMSGRCTVRNGSSANGLPHKPDNWPDNPKRIRWLCSSPNNVLATIRLVMQLLPHTRPVPREPILKTLSEKVFPKESLSV